MKLRYALLACTLFPVTALAQANAAKPQQEAPTIPKMVRDVPPVSVTDKDSIMRQVAPCWKLPAAVGAENIRVTVVASLDRGGRFTNITIPKSEGPKYHTDLAYREAANNAMAALMKCQPIRGLPADKYEGWKDMEITFDARSMPSAPAQEMLLPQESAPARSGGSLLSPAPAGGGMNVIPADQIH